MLVTHALTRSSSTLQLLSLLFIAVASTLVRGQLMPLSPLERQVDENVPPFTFYQYHSVASDPFGTIISVSGFYNTSVKPETSSIKAARSPDFGVSWQDPPVIITTLSSGRPKIAYGMGFFVTIFEVYENSTISIYWAQSSDRGKSWGPLFLLDLVGRALQVSIASNDIDRFAILFTGNIRGQDILICYPIINNKPNCSLGSFPQVTIDAPQAPPVELVYSKGVFLAVWSALSSSTSIQLDTELYFSRSEDNGITWSSPVVVNSAYLVDQSYPTSRAGPDNYPRVAYNGTVIAIAWESSYNFQNAKIATTYTVVASISFSRDLGRTWSNQSMANPQGLLPAFNSSGEWDPFVFLADGFAHVAFQMLDDNRTFLVRSSDFITWSDPIPITSSYQGSRNPQVATDGDILFSWNLHWYIAQLKVALGSSTACVVSYTDRWLTSTVLGSPRCYASGVVNESICKTIFASQDIVINSTINGSITISSDSTVVINVPNITVSGSILVTDASIVLSQPLTVEGSLFLSENSTLSVTSSSSSESFLTIRGCLELSGELNVTYDVTEQKNGTVSLPIANFNCSRGTFSNVSVTATNACYSISSVDRLETSNSIIVVFDLSDAFCESSNPKPSSAVSTRVGFLPSAIAALIFTSLRLLPS